MANENVSVREFIDTKLIPQAKEMVEAGYAYYVFGIMAQAVELVGAMYEGGIEATAKEPDRFKTGVSKVFAKRGKYTNLKNDFYQSLRNPMIHQMRPGAKLVLTEKANGAGSEDHLKQDDQGRIVLVIETLIEDFAQGMKSIYKSKEIDHLLAEPFHQVFMPNIPKNTSTKVIAGSAYPSTAHGPPLFASGTESDRQPPSIGFTYR